MLRDASHKQVIQKFSFIKSLNLSQRKSQNSKPALGKLNSDQAFSFQQQTSAAQILASKKEAQASAIVTTSDTASTINANWYQPEADAYGLSLAEIINSVSDTSSARGAWAAHHRSYLGKVLFALACSYGLFVCWWLFGHQGNRMFTMLTGGKQVVLSKSDAQFIDYMERSLDKMDRQLEAEKNSTQNRVVYVPVYTPNPVTTQLPQVASNNIPLTTSANSSLPAAPQSEAAPQALKIPAPPPLPAPTPMVDNFRQENAIERSPRSAIATFSKPAIKHTLSGILELGANQSAALVKVQGETRRVWVGEEINTSGWILESIENQRAKISYQGQVRSIAVGETF
ncbi:MAG TPA: hypothetical protein V6C71_14705 [Coleofasciculaceae cyanobacterium]|jgi:hypothetical protein